MKGSMIGPKGISIRIESQGLKPAFLQINQKGNIPKTPPKTPINRMTTNSGYPKGPIDAKFDIVFISVYFYPNAKDSGS